MCEPSILLKFNKTQVSFYFVCEPEGAVLAVLPGERRDEVLPLGRCAAFSTSAKLVERGGGPAEGGRPPGRLQAGPACTLGAPGLRVQLCTRPPFHPLEEPGLKLQVAM